MINFKKATLRYDSGISVRNLDFSIEGDEFVYIYGPSGSGKSSILKMIYMDLFPNEGEVLVFDQNSSSAKRREIARVRQQVGMVFEGFKLLADRDNYCNIALPLEIQGMKADDVHSRVVRLADDLGIRSRLHHFPQELSGGEQQRIALARAMITSPKILLADEPTAHLDSKASTDIMEWLWKIHQKGTCVIFATHKEHFLKQEPARTISLIAGEIVADSA